MTTQQGAAPPRSWPATSPEAMAEADQIIREYHAHHRQADRDKIAERFDWLAQVCARRMRRHNEPLDDLNQVARMALLAAIERFDPDFGVSFRTFASATIIGSLRRHYRSTWRLRVPRRIQELYLAASSASEHLTTTLQRSPTVREVAAYLGVDEEDILEALDAGSNYVPLSLAVGAQGDRATERRLAECDERLDDTPQRTQLMQALGSLPHRQKKALYLYYFEDMKQSEIGQELGISQVHVSRLMRAGLQTLRHNSGSLDRIDG